MSSRIKPVLRNTITAAALWVAVAMAAPAENWPGWRGPRGDGSSLEKIVPTHWSAVNNVVWKKQLPGAGHASPIVWEDRVFVTTAIPDKEERLLICLDRHNGKILWQQTVLQAPLEEKQEENSYASSTPATDGERVYMSFLDRGQVVVVAHDFSGKQVWLTRPGSFTSELGFCSPPVLCRDKVILNCDSRRNPFVVALSRADGREVWKVQQRNPAISYSTPLVREVSGRIQMIHCGSRSVTSFDPDTGAELWTVDGPSEEFVASPVYNARSGLVVICSSFPKREIFAIKPDGYGNVTKTHIAWRTTQGAPYVASLISEGSYILGVSSTGVAHCYEAATGRVLWQERLGVHHASPVAANGLVYFLDDHGVMNVVKPGPQFERVARNEIGERTYASPAISSGEIFLRGETTLFCVGSAVP